MNKTILSTLFLFLLSFLTIMAQTTTVNYAPSNDVNILNPERGFYKYSATYASNYIFLDVTDLSNQYNNQNSTLLFRHFVLDDFVNAPISSTFLSNMQQDFDAIRTTGLKCIPRFVYTLEANVGNCGSWICPPYGDASKAQILEHIGQLEVVLEANKDVIATIQMGFIGTWGEQYYTDHFGDASQPPYILTSTNWQDRNDVLGALLDAVPSERMVQVRYPQAKQRFIYGVDAPTTSAPLQSGEAYNGSDKARIGFHNDCFLASDDDFGTFTDYGPPVSQSDTTNLKPYKENDSKYVVVGGETCFVNNPDDNCAIPGGGGRADLELKRFHYSYLNADYNLDVNNDWNGVCMDDIKKSLGYRLVMLSGTFSNEAQPGQSITVNISLKNEGYAAPYNERGLELVLRSLSTEKLYFAPLNADPRDWHPGEIYTINETLCLPPSLPHDNYELLLNLPDPMPSLFNRHKYAIQMANEFVWEFNTGYNRLGHNLIVTPWALSGVDCAGETMATSISIYDPSYCPNFLFVNGNIQPDTYIAGSQILSSGSIDSYENAYFQAGNSICLEPDFTVKVGAGLIIVSEDCK